MDLADRILTTLGAILIVLINELRLFNIRPRMEEGPYVNEVIMRGVSGVEPVFLSTVDLWLRGGLAAVAVLVALWSVQQSLREVTAKR